MSVVTFDWAPAETETKTGIPKATENYPRKEEFRLALDRYIADYAAHQRRRAEAIGSTAGTPFISHNLARFAGWLRLWRRPLRATREIWLSSHEVSRDWRQPRQHHPHPERESLRDERAEAARIVEHQDSPACLRLLKTDNRMTVVSR